ncbi:radical SAM protein [Shimazuella kribbensis]|uniref:radical SAM protein n=1 Tax=Shimazuella kribbensis TaxID=139808 RepID=UPI00040842D1|nr:radical SAM protein [Shimazuella kribbensis]
MFPITNFVLKVYSDCNLRCKYCYVYFGADQSWKEKPLVVTDQVMEDTARAIAEHVRAHGLKVIRVIFHGGEPFLARSAGKLTMITYIRKIRHAVGEDCQVKATVQTNGTLLTEANIREMEDERISIGVSLDGGTPELNHLRVTKGGKPAFKRTVRGIKLLAARPRLADGFYVYAGLLCTINVNTDPEMVYPSFKKFRPLSDAVPFKVILLIPHANHDSPPPMPEIGRWKRFVQKFVQQGEKLTVSNSDHVPDRVTPLGDWLCKIFDCWKWDPSGPIIPLFRSMISVNRMGQSRSDEIGLSPFGAIVVETDGSMELDDDLKSAFANAPYTGLNVATSTFNEALNLQGIKDRQLGKKGVPKVCRDCIFNTKCGGGNYAHRYKNGSFDNPSVYCEDLKVFFTHISKESERMNKLRQLQA